MLGWQHALVALCITLGAFMGGVFIDLDHFGNWACKWKYFWGIKPDYADGKHATCDDGSIIYRGVFHNPLLIFSVAGFSIVFGMSLLFHMWMDKLV